MIESVRTPELKGSVKRSIANCDFCVKTSKQGKSATSVSPVTSSSLVPTSTSNESHTRSDELRASSKFTTPRVSHSCRRAPRSFQIRNSRSRSTEDRRPPCSASTTARIRGKELNGAPLACLPCFCSVSCAQLFVHARTRRWAVQHIMRQCTTMTENKCCASMACGWCVAQTLLLTRVAKTTSTWRLSALPTAQEVSDQHFEKQFVLALRDPHLLWYTPPEQLAKRLAKQARLKPVIRIFVRTTNNLD